MSPVRCDRDEEQKDARLLVGALAAWDIAGSWKMLRLRESKGARVFQMELRIPGDLSLSCEML